MRVKLIKGKIRVEFPLTQPKRSWKIRINGKKSLEKILGHKIQNRYKLEWMVDYRELRDILFCFKEKCPSGFEKMYEKFTKLKPNISRPEDFRQERSIKVGNIVIEIKLLKKQRKPSERFPYVFILFNLFYTKILSTTRVFLVDIWDRKIIDTSNRTIKIGDTLVWLPTKEEVWKIINELGKLSLKHKESAEKMVFNEIAKF